MLQIKVYKILHLNNIITISFEEEGDIMFSYMYICTLTVTNNTFKKL